MTQRSLSLITALSATLLLAACAAGQHSATPTPSVSATTHSAIPSSTATPTIDSAPIPASERVVNIRCYDSVTSGSVTYPRLRDAWGADSAARKTCEVDGFVGVDSRVSTEEPAVEASGGRALAKVYAQCAEASVGYDSAIAGLSSDQATEATGALTLCPDHPDAAKVQALIAQGQANDAAVADGSLVYAGTYKVGQGIRVGTYVTESETAFKSCYWEALDAAGNILANNFATDAFRVEMTVPPNAYSVRIEGCGGFRLQ